jgi:diguanylate cyclase (GGDEF)-like protein
MPEMDGFAVMDALKSLDVTGYVPILAITADAELRLRALSSGAKDFIAKPFELSELTSRVHNMLEVRLLYNALAQSVHELESIALHDELTGLPNRRLLLDRLHHAGLVSERSGMQAALMFLDLDQFKQVNDQHGHEAGDLLLQQVAARLQSGLREGDSVSRLGGDEFVLLLEALSPHSPQATEQAQRVAHKVLLALRQSYLLPGAALQCTASIGVVLFSGNTPATDALLKMADSAMYRAKAAGGNQICFFDPALPSAPPEPAVAQAGPAPCPFPVTDQPELLP